MPYAKYGVEYSDEELDKRYTEWKAKINNAILSPQEADNEYLKQLDVMTRRAFKDVRKDKKAFAYNVRAMEDLNYRGRNRIISIVEIDEPEWEKRKEGEPTLLKVHYGNIPDDFINQYKERVGGEFKIIK